MVAQIILIFSNFYTSVLQSFNKFIIPAMAPVTYNLGIIIFIILFAGRYGIYAPAYGMVFGSILHMLIQLPMVRSLGFSYKLKFKLFDKGVLEVYRLMIPRTIGQMAQRLLIPFYTNLAL
ncbi:lipid II flippase MurJ, partial [Arthrospira platensis SPKY2]